MKNIPMYKRYNKLSAFYALTAFHGIALFFPDEIDNDPINDYIIAAWYDGENYSGFHKHKINYTVNGCAYIRKSGRKIYLHDCMRTNY